MLSLKVAAMQGLFSASAAARGALRTSALPNISAVPWFQCPPRRSPAAAAAPDGGARRVISYSSADHDPVPLASEGPRPSVDITKREALRLYRECLRTAKMFTWRDKDGVHWRDKLAASARKVRRYLVLKKCCPLKQLCALHFPTSHHASAIPGLVVTPAYTRHDPEYLSMSATALNP